MKILYLSIVLILLVIALFPDNAILAQNETQPKIEFDHANYFTRNMSCNFYNTEKISAQDQEQSKATVIVTDSDANKFSTAIDRVIVLVWSDSDQKGVEITAYETEVNSGIFRGEVAISEGQSTQDIVHVSNGDTLSARYASVTPGSFDTTSRDIITTSFIGMSCPPLERVPASSIRILDNKGNEHNVTTVDQQVLITSDVANPTITNQTFAYIVQIQDKNGSTASLAWLSGTILPNQTFSPSVSWTPSKVGNYVVTIFVWQSLTNPNALSPPIFTDLTVLHGSATYNRSVIGNVENLHCKLGFELVIKSKDNSPACVRSDTAKKLVERGWTKHEHYYIDPHMSPKVTLYDYVYDGMNKDDAIVSINNQTYYQTTLNYTVDNLTKGYSVTFRNVTFTFPEGILDTPGGSMTILDMKFSDGSEETYGKKIMNQDGSGFGSGIAIPSKFGPPAITSIIVLSNHVMPQAGLTIYHNKISLLVSK